MRELDQERAPIYEALEKFRKMRVVPFDVPGHKRGRGNPELAALLGETCVQMDVNSMKPLDNLCHPVSVIKEAEELTAAAFHAAHAFLMVGGTTSAVQSMVLSVVRRVRVQPLVESAHSGSPLPSASRLRLHDDFFAQRFRILLLHDRIDILFREVLVEVHPVVEILESRGAAQREVSALVFQVHSRVDQIPPVSAVVVV